MANNTLKHNTPYNNQSFIKPPAYHIAGNLIFGRLAAAVAHSRGYPMSNMEYAKIMAKPASTTSYWLGVSPQPQLVACFCLLEHLTPEERHAIVDALCRPLPLLDHPWLSHNSVTVAALKNMLRQERGLTLITGSDAEQRSFLFSALGHTFCRLDSAHRHPVGIDLHEPSQWVPVETLSYLRVTHRLSETLSAIRQLWPVILTSKHPIILLNGVWSLAPQYRRDILKLAHRRQVVLADKTISLASKSTHKTGLPVNRLTISHSRKHPQWLEVAFRITRE